MMNKSKMTTLAAVATAAALTLAGCSSESSGGEGGSEGNEPVTMTLWHNSTTGEGREFWEQTVADFMEEYDHVTIDIEAIQNEDLDGKLQNALNADTAPDIFMQRGGGKMRDMVNAGQLMDLTDKLTGPGIEEIPEGAWSANMIDGRLYAAPIAVLPGGIWYSADLFDEAGIDSPPGTLDELIAANDKLKAAGIAPIAVGAQDAWPAAFWYYHLALRQCSPETMEEAANTMEFNHPCWEEAAQTLADFVATEPFNPGFLTTSAQQGASSSAGLLANHQAAMELMGAWNPGVIGSLTPDEEPLADLAWMPFPEVPGGEGLPGSMLGGIDGYSCAASAPAECLDFLSWITKSDVQEAYYKAFSAPTVNVESQKAITESYLQDALEAFNSAPYSSQWLDTVYGSNVGNALNVAVVEVLAGQTDAAGLVQAVNDAAARN